MIKPRIKPFRGILMPVIVVMLIMATISGICSVAPFGAPVFYHGRVHGLSVLAPVNETLNIIETISVSLESIPHTAEDQDIPSSIWQCSFNSFFSGPPNQKARYKSAQSNPGQAFIFLNSSSGLYGETLLACSPGYIYTSGISSLTCINTTHKLE
jgi:hypothetical protein